MRSRVMFRSWELVLLASPDDVELDLSTQDYRQMAGWDSAQQMGF